MLVVFLLTGLTGAETRSPRPDLNVPRAGPKLALPPELSVPEEQRLEDMLPELPPEWERYYYRGPQFEARLVWGYRMLLANVYAQRRQIEALEKQVADLKLEMMKLREAKPAEPNTVLPEKGK